jgi:hypothetical protein
LKKTLIILLTVLLLMLFPTASSAFDPPKENKNNESAAKLPIEDVNRLFIVDMLSGYTAKPIKEHYGISLPWQLEFAKIIDAELIYEHDTPSFIFKLQVQPFVGAHNPVALIILHLKCRIIRLRLKNMSMLKVFLFHLI